MLRRNIHVVNVYIVKPEKEKQPNKISEGIRPKKLEVYWKTQKNRQEISKRKWDINELGNRETAEPINEFPFPLGNLF